MEESNLEFLAFNEVGIAFAVIAIACGFIKLVYDATKAIHDWRISLKRPTDDRIEKVEKRLQEDEDRITKLECCCEEVHGKLKADWQFQQDETEMNRLMLKSIKQLLKHSLDGDDTQGLKAMEDEIDGYLVNHAQ